MGCSSSVDSAASISREIDREISKTRSEEMKLLILGTGDCGKSTLAKQMRLLFLDGFSHEEVTKENFFFFLTLLNCS